MHLIVAFIFLGLISDLFSFHMIVRVCFYISVLLQFLKKKENNDARMARWMCNVWRENRISAEELRAG